MKGKKRKKGRIAIVGMSCWYPGSQSLAEFWENILARRQQFRRLRDERLPMDQYHSTDRTAEDKTYGSEAAVLDGFEFDWQQKRIPKRTYDSTDIVHWLALEVAQKALADSGLSLAALQSVQTGVVLGNTLTGEWTRTNAMRMRWPFVEKVIRANSTKYGMEGPALEEFIGCICSSYKSVFPEITEDTLAGGLSNTIAGRICNVLDLQGGGYTVDGACSSSLLAIINAARSLVQGDLDIAFAGGIDISLDTFELIGFAKTGALTTDEMRVYDKRANGFIPGEGCGFVMLKRLADAERDGDKIYAVINGWGLSSDGKGGLTAPSIDGQARAISKAYQMAGYPLSEVSFIEGHGTGTTLGDKVEISALVKVLDQNIPSARIGLTSLKSVFGHTKAAAGIGGLIKAAIGVNQRIMPPMAGVEDPNQLFSAEAKYFIPVVEGVRFDEDGIIRAGVSAMGFGGINTHVTLESYGPAQENLQSGSDVDLLLTTYDTCEILAFSANSQTSLKRVLAAAVRSVRDLSRAELGDYARHLGSLSRQGDAYRAAIVVRRPEQAFKAINTLSDWLAAPLKDQEVRCEVIDGSSIYLGKCGTAPQVTMMFPGQGAQKIKMGRSLIRRYAWAREMAAVADEIFKQYSNESLLGLFQSEGNEAVLRLDQTDITQPAVTLVNALWLEALKRFGVQAENFAGHSLGELSAFYAAGAFDFKVLMQLACKRGALMAGSARRPGAMAYVACDEKRCSALIDGIEGYLVVANKNELEQTVVGGDAAAVTAFIGLAKKHGLRAGLLKSSNAFHTEFMQKPATKFAAFIDSLETTQPTKNVFSGIDGALISNEESVSAYFSRQMQGKVDFISLVEAVAASSDLVIEVGPSQILTGLYARISGKDHNACLPVESRPGADKDLKVVLASAFAHGANVRWEEVYRDRFFNAYVSSDEKIFIDNPVERAIKVRSDSGSQVQFNAAVIPASAQLLIPVPTVEKSAAVVTLVDQTNIIAGQTSAAARQLADKPETVILQIVSDLTGFQLNSLQPELRLLDDLNLDSIKITELIYRLSSYYNISEQLETSAYTNASIGELAVAIGAQISQTVPVLPVQPAVAAAVQTSEPSVPFEIAMKASVKTPGLKAGRRAGWVRNFKEKMVKSPLPMTAAFSWTGKRVTLFGPPDEADLIVGAAAFLITAGADVCVVTRPEELKHADLSTRQITIVVVPSAATSHDAVVEQLASAVRARFGRGHSLVFAQFDDGFFGQTLGAGRLFSAKAFAASIGYERPDLNVRVLSFSQKQKNPEDFVHIIATEIAQKGSSSVVGYDDGYSRYRQTLEADRPVEYTARNIVFGKKDVVVVTGGAKGITRACAEAVAAKYGCSMAVIGSSPWGKDEQADGGHAITVAMTAFRSLGVPAEYYSCDLGDQPAVIDVVKQIRDNFGDPTVLIHGAGLNTPKPATIVEVADALREMAPKLKGMNYLLNELDANTLKFIGALTSVIGVVGMPGNSWYAFANDALDLTLRRYSEKTGVPVCSYAYSVWSEIGMGARMGSDKHLEQKGIGSVSPEEGVARFMYLLEHRGADQQTVIASRLGSINAGCRTNDERYAVDFTDNLISLQPGVEAVAIVKLTHAGHPYLLDHNYKGSYLFPTVFGLEAMAQVANAVTGISAAAAITIEEIKLTRPIVVGQDGLEIEVWAEQVENSGGNQAARIRCGIRTALTGNKIDHFQAVFVIDEQSIAPKLVFPDSTTDLGIVPERDLYDSVLFQGPMFQRLSSILHLESDNETAGRTLFTSRVEQKISASYLLGDPFFRDSLLQSAQIIIPQNQCLPIGIERIRLVPAARSQLNRICYTDVYKSGEKSYLATVEVRNQAGDVIELMENYQLRFLEKRPQLPKAMDLIPTGNAATPVVAAQANPLLAPYLPVADLLRIDAEPNGPQTQAVFVHRFIPDFKTFSNLSRSIHFSHIFNWMGWAREMSSIPVLDRIRTLTESGKYGLVTNWASIEVLGDCRNKHRIVESRMWCGKMSGQMNSSAVLTFDWLSRGETGVEERIAVGRMGFTWVEIVGHGVVKPAPFPGYYQDFIENMVAKNDEPDVFSPAPEPYRNLQTGNEEFLAPAGPGSSVTLCSKFFETSLYDSNLVGNLYFGNYSVWMGKLRDEFFYSLAPGLYRGIGEFGELTCVKSRIQHLREAMPFDDIYVTMGMTGLSTNAVDLHFEFFKVDGNGQREKLAVATHNVIWTIAGENGDRVSAPLPPAIFQKLYDKTNNTISIAAAS